MPSFIGVAEQALTNLISQRRLYIMNSIFFSFSKEMAMPMGMPCRKRTANQKA
jgi:hypothetical protein